MSLIDNNDSLREFCGRVKRADFITVDTEFIRDKTYWSQLCLIQIAGPDEEAAIDTLADGIDLTPVLDLFRDPDLLKVFHSARQDFEIIYKMMGALPAPVFDTQVSAMVCGFGDSVGYETLVNKLVNKSVDKSMRFTDWQRRPLSDKQIDYALSDVTHLRVVYEKIIEKIGNNGRAEWVAEEMAALTSPAIYQFEHNEAWRRLKLRNPHPRQLALVRELAALRESEAQRRDVPRNRIMRDDAIMEIAVHKPKTRDDLKSLRGVHGGQTGGGMGDLIIAAVERGLAIPDEDCPKPPAQSRSQRTPLGSSPELLKVLLKLTCEKHDVAQKLIANSDDIDAILRDDDADVRALKGWRRDIYGEPALALKHGRIALTVKGKKIQVVETP